MTEFIVPITPSASELFKIVSTLKTAILRNRYVAAKNVNKHVINLYFQIGAFIDHIISTSNWGEKIIDSISDLLKQELPGQRGFSSSNLRKMRSFYNTWKDVFEICSLTTNKLKYSTNPLNINDLEICSLTTNKLSQDEYDAFMSVGFTHHYEISSKKLSLEDRLFYIEKCARQFWNIGVLRRKINEEFHKSTSIKGHSFNTTISDELLRSKALKAFKDEYLLDFINLDVLDPDDIDERILENEIVQNIKSFIMSFGSDFAFMGNQYRLEVEGETLYIDLLFFHRGLKCLVAVELKSGKFKGAYAGQLNTYLSALDDLIRKPDENPSIGLILCKEKSDKIVEYAFRDTTKPMGVATYKLTSKLPQEYKNALPNPEDLRKLLEFKD